MKKDVSVIRESIGKIVALLTNRSINVTQRGAKAFVQYHAKTGAIQLVNIPYLPDDASEEFISAVQGFLDHEVGHVLYTDPKVVTMLRKESAKVKNLANAIEDVYIERKMAQAFTGSTGNLNSVRRFYLDKVAKPKIDEALASGDANAAAGYASLVQFRAWGGQQMAADFLADNPEYAKLTEPLAKKLGADLIEKIKKAGSSKECLDLARAMCKKMEEKAPPSPPTGEKGDSKDSSGAPSDKPGEDDGSSDEPRSDDTTEDDDKPDAEDEGTTRAEADDSGKERDEKSESDIEDAPPEVGDDGGSDGGDHTESDDEPEAGSDAPGEGDDEPAEDDDEGESEDDQPDDGLSIAGEGGDDPDGDEDSDSDSETDGEGGEDLTESAPEEATAKGTDERESAEQEEVDPFDKERDFDDDMSRALTEAAIGEIKGSSYQIFSTDWDKIEPAPQCRDPKSIERMVDKTQHMIASIQKTLERAISAKDRKTWNPGQRRGRIAPGALFRTVVGDDRVFRKRYETHAKNTAVTLLVDCSGSMGWGGKIQVAGMAAFALSSTLERLKVSHEVIGFTTRESRPMTAAIKAEGGGLRYARAHALYMPVFKGFKERMGVESKSRLAHLTERPEWLCENVDGECLRIAAQRLKQQRAERHVLIVLSDGSPACPGDYTQLAGNLKATARELDKDSGVEVIGVGVMDSSVRSFYDKHLVLNDINELPTTLIAELSKVLLAP